MPGYQFIHIEAYSRAPARGGRSVSYVLDEAERKPEAVPHVVQPRAAELIHGIGLAELRREHDDRAGEARAEIAGGRSRAIRRDQHTMLTAVASFPTPWAEMDDQGRKALEAWEARNVAWLQARYGDQLRTVVRHTDERFPHLHAYVLPDGPAMRASTLHDGFAAKAAVMSAGGKPSDPDQRKALNREGDRAYRDAMRTFQGDYWAHVGLDSGLARLGPGKRRLSREGWHQERTAADSVAVARREHDKALEAAHGLKERGQAFVSRTQLEASRTRQEAAQVADRAQTELREAEARRREATDLLASAQTEASGLRNQALGRGRATIREAQAKAAEILEDAERRSKSIGTTVGHVLTAVRHAVADPHAKHEQEIERARNEERSAAQEAVEMASGGRKAAEAEAARERRLRQDAERQRDTEKRERQAAQERARSLEARLRPATPVQEIGQRPRGPSLGR